MANPADPPDFAARMADILNGAALGVAIAIGYRTGLLDLLGSLAAPGTSPEIAARAGLSERYVREWLALLGSGGVLEMSRGDGGETRYRLPPERAAHLTRSAGPANLAVYAQEIPLLTGSALEDVIAAFRSGAGVPYARYPRFQAFMAELAEAKHRRVLVREFLPAVDGGRLVARLREGIRVCDLGCGEGVAAALMAEAFPASRVTGIDLDAAAVARARQSAAGRGLANLEFRVADAARLAEEPAWRGAFDYVTAFDAIHDQTAPLAALRGVRASLAEGGLFSMVDIAAHSDPLANADHPLGAFLYAVSLLHCLPVGLVDGGTGLGMMWGRERAEELLAAAGFAAVEVAPIPNDAFNLHFLCRAP